MRVCVITQTGEREAVDDARVTFRAALGRGDRPLRRHRRVARPGGRLRDPGRAERTGRAGRGATVTDGPVCRAPGGLLEERGLRQLPGPGAERGPRPRRRAGRPPPRALRARAILPVLLPPEGGEVEEGPDAASAYPAAAGGVGEDTSSSRRNTKSRTTRPRRSRRGRPSSSPGSPIPPPERSMRPPSSQDQRVSRAWKWARWPIWSVNIERPDIPPGAAHPRVEEEPVQDSWRRPAKRSSRLAGPSGPSKA